MTVTRTIEISDINPEELALIFSNYSSIEQALFFNALKPITDKWAGAGWCQQSSQIALRLDNGGAEIVAKLAEWAADPLGENI